MHLFFNTNLINETTFLSEEESKHCARVLRKKLGDEIVLIDGKGSKATCIITNDNPKKCELNIVKKETFLNEKPILHVAIAPTKNFDKMDWMLEKCTEIGIHEISFIETENSERNKVNVERCKKILIQSIKQSKQFWLPKLNNIVSLKQFLTNHTLSNANCLMAWCNEHALKLDETLNYSNPTIVLIGPEGDFTENEVKMAQQNNFKTISLGNSILRTETAAVYVASLVNHFYQK